MATYLILYMSYRFVLPVLITGGSTLVFAFELTDPVTSRVNVTVPSGRLEQGSWARVD